MKELHIRLYEQKGNFYGELVPLPADPNGTAGVSSIPLPAQARARRCRLPLPPPLPSGKTLTGLQDSLIELQSNAASADVDSMGKYLCEFLFGPEGKKGKKGKRNLLYEHWQKCFDASQQPVDNQQPVDRRMRTVLHLDSPSLSGVPWELLRFKNEFLVAMSQNHTFLRMAWGANVLNQHSVMPIPDRSTHEPLRVLLVVGHSPDDDTEIMGREEALLVDQALYRLLPWQVDLHVLVRPSFNKLWEWCRDWQPHVFHFIGHGDYLESYKTGVLELFQGDGVQPKPITPDQLVSIFEHGVPRLVVLNACRSGQEADLGAETPVANAARATQSFSQALIERGVLAVIAMQADIKGEAAAQLMDQFYRTLAEGEPLDMALRTARRAVMVPGQGLVKSWDGAIPALHVALGHPVNGVFLLEALAGNQPNPLSVMACPPGDATAERERQRIEQLQLYAKIQVGRDWDRLELERRLFKSAPAGLGASERVTVLTGKPDMGKTYMLFWLAEACARRDHKFVYVDFDHQSLNFWDALRLIRDGRLEGRGCGLKLNNLPDPDIGFNLFNHVLNSRLSDEYAATQPTPPAPEMPVAELPATKGKNPTSTIAVAATAIGGESAPDTIVDAFWKCLARAAVPGGLLLVLDHIDDMSDPEIWLLRANLIDRVLKPDEYPDARNVRIVLALQDRTGSGLGNSQQWLTLQNAPGVFNHLLTGLPHQDVEWLAKAWARRYFISYRPAAFRASNTEVKTTAVDKYVDDVLKLSPSNDIAPGAMISLLTHPLLVKRLLPT